MKKKCLEKIAVNVQEVIHVHQNIEGFRSEVTLIVGGQITHIFLKRSMIFVKQHGEIVRARLSDLKFATRVRVCIKKSISATEAIAKKVIILQSNRAQDLNI